MYGTNPGDDRATLAQSGIWFTERLGGLGTVYSMPFAITFHGELDAPALLAACRTVLARHPVLSCAAQERAGLPVLVPAPVPPQPVTVDLTGTPELLEGLEHAEISRPFDLAQGPLIRCTLFRTAPDRARLLVVAHHLAFDGQSTSVFLDDLAAAYAGTALPALPAAEHPDDQEDRIAEALPGAREFWRRHWSEPEEVQLPGLRGTPAPAAPGEAVEFELPDDLRAAVGGLGLSNFQFTLASWLVLLRRYGNRAPVIGVDLGTRGPGERQRIGAHVNELPVAHTPDLAQSFRRYAQALGFAYGLGSDLRGLYRYREVPLARAVPGIRPAVALAPITLGYRRRMAAPEFPGLTATVDWALPNGTVRGALRIHLVDGPEAWRVMLQYDPTLLGRGDVERIAGHWRTLARALAEHPDVPLAGLPFAPEEAARVQGWNDTFAARPDTTLPELFAEQAARTPDAVAVQEGARSLTYRQLDTEVEGLTNRLLAAGARPGTLVALLAERSTVALIGQLAVLRSGAGYLPLDPDHPADRLAELLADSAAELVLTRRELLPALPPTAAEVLLLDEDEDKDEDATDAPSGTPPRPGDRAYVLYTSGSTGRPKGVEVEHRSLVNLLLAFRDRLACAPEHRWLALTALTFDISALELFLPLVTGGRVVIAPPAAVKDGRDVARLVREHAVTHVQATPSGWQLLLEGGLDVPGLTALVGGEALAPTLAGAIAARSVRLLNVYGPTETTIWSTAAELPSAGAGSIGTPLANTTAYVLDERGDELPIGLSGELWLGGAGLARGYLGRPGLTADRFRPDPYGAPGARRYRTGDLVRRRVDGSLDFLGRLDGQVKLRGHRIELGEIEARLLEHPGVARAAVSVVEGAGGGRLVAHLVTVGAPPRPDELREHLARTLPAVMVPTGWELLDELPLTAAGKVDRVALRSRPSAPEPREELEQEAPTGPTAVIQEIWCQVLGLPAVGPDEDLFDLGGHSLMVAQIAARISARFGVDLPLHVFYDDATVTGMAAAVAIAVPDAVKVREGNSPDTRM